MRFELIDRVIDATDDSLVATRCVTAAEEYLADHFPGFAVLPGVMMLEALAQAGRALVRRLDPAPGASRLVVAEAKNVKYGTMVRPGQTLTVTVKLTGRADAGYAMTGEGTVDGQTAVKGKFVLAPPPPDTFDPAA
ncbi:MAG: 3-hydroxyacyl-ACP dehydratase FabZ family protein [Planctomycetota bacterium]